MKDCQRVTHTTFIPQVVQDKTTVEFSQLVTKYETKFQELTYAPRLVENKRDRVQQSQQGLNPQLLETVVVFMHEVYVDVVKRALGIEGFGQEIAAEVKQEQPAEVL